MTVNGVAIIEMDRAGGTCLNHGCKPTKALRASASVAHQARRARIYGVNTGEVTVDFPAAMARVRSIIDGLRESLDDWLAGVPGLDQFHGQATVVTDPAGEGHHVSVDHQDLSAQELYLNLGARATRPPLSGLETVEAMTEVELLALDSLPEHLLIIGGGYIGLEFGQMFRRSAPKSRPLQAAVLLRGRTRTSLRCSPRY